MEACRYQTLLFQSTWKLPSIVCFLYPLAKWTLSSHGLRGLEQGSVLFPCVGWQSLQVTNLMNYRGRIMAAR